LQSLYDGDIAVVTVVYSGKDLCTPSDPGSAMLAYKVGATGTPITLVWDGSNITPSIGNMARLGVGTYQAWLDTTGRPGQWYCQGQSTGANQAASQPTEFKVLASL
jgi:hypothetical protein